MMQDTCAPQSAKADKSEELATLSAISSKIYALEELVNEMKLKNLAAVRQASLKSKAKAVGA